jgi:hypothetical protein
MEIDKELEKLDPAVRKRVESSLKAALEAELAKGGMALGENPAAVFSRSKGWVFSRSRTSDVLRDPPELVRNLQAMDEAAFQKFANRLATLKRLKDVKSGEQR